MKKMTKTIDHKTTHFMKDEALTKDDLIQTLNERNVRDGAKQERIVAQLQVTGALIAMLSDVIDSLMNDEEELFRLLAVKYKQEKKFHKNQMQKAASSFHYHMREFTRNFFETEDSDMCMDMEDCAQDYYDIVKLLADHASGPKDFNQIKASLRRRKCNHHIFEE